jgi:predicted ATP-grasp superfamily ATP-dependent carboligase
MREQILIFDANSIGMIAAIRSLGRGGYRPHAVSSRPDALGFKSRFAYRASVHPDYSAAGFIHWLREYVEEYSIRGIVCDEAMLTVIHDHYDEFSHLIPDPVAEDVRRRCLSKARVFTHLSQERATAVNMPRSGVIECGAGIELLLTQCSAEAIHYLKPDREFARSPGQLPRVVRVNPTEDLEHATRSCLDLYTAVLWQRHVPGQQVGVSFWLHGGEILAENMVLGLHMYPFRAGSMSHRTTWWHDRIMADAKLKIRSLQWTGVAMLEYKWDPATDEFWFIELNPRIWAYLHLDISCGRDFPRWQMDTHLGLQAVRALGPPTLPRAMRYAPGEVIHLASRLVARDLKFSEKLRSFIEYFRLGLNPAVKEDHWFAGDRYLYFRGWARFLRDLPSKVLKNLRNTSYVGERP